MNVAAHSETKSLVIQAPDPFLIRSLLPKSKLVDHPEYNVALKLTVEATKVLRNIGLDVPSPITAFYTWPGKFTPLDHQKKIAEFHTLTRRHFDLSEMGAMKTASALWAADWLMQQGTIKKAMILAPLSTLDRVWMQEIFDVLMHRRAAIVHGSREDRKKALATNVDFYIMNHDAVKIKEITELIRKRADIDLIIVDEGSKFRNHSTDKYKGLVRLLRDDMRLWWLTGTPCPTAPTDAWSQAKIVNPTSVPQYFGSFKRQTMMQMTPFKWAPRNDSYKLAWQAMQPAIRFLKKDCIDLPPMVTEDRQAGLSPEQKAAFKDMRNNMYLDYMRDQQTGAQITAVNAADKLTKLRQILCGAVRDPATGEYITLPHAPRLRVLTETIEEAAAKVLIIVPFKGIIYDLEKDLAVTGKSVAVLNGDVPIKARDRILTDFKTQTDPHMLLCHPAVMAHGLNLTEADMLIFYAPIFSNDDFEQVKQRFNRAGQTRKMTLVRIAAHPLECEIYKTLDNRAMNQNNILRLYKQVVLG